MIERIPPMCFILPPVASAAGGILIKNMIRTDYDIKPLAAAIVLQAAIDAKRGDRAAREWLQHDGIVFMDVIGVTLDRAQMQRWIRRGCKIPGRGGLRLGS